MTISMEDIVSSIDDLPSLPAVLMEVLDSVDQEEINIYQLTRKIMLDQSLTAKILRFANSSFYNTQSRVTTIQQAINLIGLSGIRSLIMTAVFKHSFPVCPCKGFDFNVFWRHSIAVGVCAKVLARHLQLNQDYAYTAGLLHDIGRLVLVTRFTRRYEETIEYRAEQDCHILVAERAMLGTDHVIAGQALAEHWNFSKGIQNAIAKHHEPDVPGGDTVASVVHVADAIAHALDFSGEQDDLVPPLSMEVWNALGLDHDAAIRVFRETELRYEAARLGLAA
jgi:putative nucleotidyltransferase with HDIG domain